MQHSIDKSQTASPAPSPFLDQQMQELDRYLRDIEDDLPMMDILVGRGSKQGWFRGSVAVFLPDVTLHAHAESRSADLAIQQAFDQIRDKVRYLEQARKHIRGLLRKAVGSPDQFQIWPLATKQETH